MDSPLKSRACQPGWPLFSPGALLGKQQAESEEATRQERKEEEGGPAREGGPEPSQLWASPSPASHPVLVSRPETPSPLTPPPHLCTTGEADPGGRG